MTSIGRIILRNLRTKLRNVGQHGACDFNDFLDSLETYCQNLMKRLTTEELQILPLAQRVISNDEWFDIAAKFISHESERRGNRDFDPEAVEMLPIHPANQLNRTYQSTATQQAVN